MIIRKLKYVCMLLCLCNISYAGYDTLNNLVYNGDFESNFSGWHKSALAEIVFDDAGTGFKCSQLTRTDGGAQFFFSQRIPVTGGEVLLIEFSNKYTSYSSGTLSFYLRNYDSSGFISQTLKQPSNSDSWQTQSYEIAVDPDADEVDLLFWLNPSTVATYRVDNVTVFREVGEIYPGQAFNFLPENKTRYTASNVELSWDSSEYAETFDVYVGQDKEAVNSVGIQFMQTDINQDRITNIEDFRYLANQWFKDVNDLENSADFFADGFIDLKDMAIFAVNFLTRAAANQEIKTKPLNNLELGQTYYWRVDEVNEVYDTVGKGEVQSFFVGYVTVDDFEIYGSNNLITDIWSDGVVNSTGSDIYLENMDYFEGSQCLKLNYFNDGQPYYSEIMKYFSQNQNWLSMNADTLAIYFKGSDTNSEEQLYVGVEDSSSNIHFVNYAPRYGNKIDLRVNKWHIWYVPFSAFSGIDMDSVSKIYLGIGDRDNPYASGAGSLLIDEIRIERHKHKLFDKGSLPVDVIDVVDVQGIDIEAKLAAVTLQGQVNKLARSRVYLDNGSSRDDHWLDWFLSENHIKDYNQLSVSQFFSKYDGCYRTVVVYDPDLPATINAATMIASVENGIVIHPDDIYTYGFYKDHIDLQGTWTKNIDVYQWVWDNYRDKMNPCVVANYHPTATVHNIRDILIADRIFTTWVTGENVEDGIVSDYDQELAFAEMVWGNTPANIPIIGWWGTAADRGIGEYTGVGLAGQYGKLCVPFDWGRNTTITNGMRVDVEESAKHYNQLTERQSPVLDNSKVYVCFNIMESGDSPPYWQGRQLDVWNHGSRGQIPIGWSVGGVTWELFPGLLDWFYHNATPNDDFFMALSGATYAHPYRDFLTQTSDYNASWNNYLNLTQHYMDLQDMGKLGLYIDAGSIERSEIDPITLKFVNNLSDLDILLLGMHRNDGIGDWNYRLGNDNTLCSHLVTKWNSDDIGRSSANNQWLADDIVAHTPSQRPAFIQVQCLSWSYYPEDILDVYNRLPSEYIAVSHEEFIELYQQAGN